MPNTNVFSSGVERLRRAEEKEGEKKRKEKGRKGRKREEKEDGVGRRMYRNEERKNGRREERERKKRRIDYLLYNSLLLICGRPYLSLYFFDICVNFFVYLSIYPSI